MKTNKGFVLTVSLILVLLVVIVGVFYFKNKKSNPAPEQPVGQTENQSLKEYKNEEVGISFLYNSSFGEIKTSVANIEPKGAVQFSGELGYEGIHFVADSRDFYEKLGEPLFVNLDKKTGTKYTNPNGVIFLEEKTSICDDEVGDSKKLNTCHWDGYGSYSFNTQSSKFPQITLYGKYGFGFQSLVDSIKLIPTDVKKLDNTKESTTTADPKDPNLITYTSYKLGIQFNYLKDGGFGLKSLTPLENGDKISFIENDASYVSKENYIMVFKQSSNESVEQTLRRVVPEYFRSQYCAVEKSSKDSNVYFIWDSRIPLSYQDPQGFMGDYTPYSGLKEVCTPALFGFKTNKDFPGVVYYVNREAQAVSYWADSKHTLFWFETVHLIPNN